MSFDAAGTIEAPGGFDELVGEECFFRGGRGEGLVELLAERVEVGGVFAVEEEARGAESVGGAIFAGGGFAFGGTRAGGLGGVLTIGGGAFGDGGEFGLVFLPGGGFGVRIEGFQDSGLLEKEMEKPAAPVGRSGLLLIGEYPVVSRNLGGGAGGDIERKGDILMFGASTTCKTPHKTLERGGGDRLKVFFPAKLPAKLQQGALMSDFGE
ncbi:MAG: hypothetical protein ACK6D7_17580 [Acidobacteriota bacterium]